MHGGISPARQPRARPRAPGRALVRVATSAQQQQQQYFAGRFHRARCFRSHPAWWPCQSARGGADTPWRQAACSARAAAAAAPAHTPGASLRVRPAAGRAHARPGRRAGRPCPRGLQQPGSRAPRGSGARSAGARARGALSAARRAHVPGACTPAPASRAGPPRPPPARRAFCVPSPSRHDERVREGIRIRKSILHQMRSGLRFAPICQNGSLLRTKVKWY